MRLRAELRRLPSAPVWWSEGDPLALGAEGGQGWQSNGGSGRRHPARALPFTLECAVPQDGALERVWLLGIFALHASPEEEPSGALGGAVIFSRARQTLHRADLIQGRHYGDASDPLPIYRPNGDGTCLETVGTVEVDGAARRVDALMIELPPGARPDTLALTDLGTSASFVIFDAVFELAEPSGCPFRGSGDKIGLGEVSSILRLRDRARFDSALGQIHAGIVHGASDLEEAKGLGLTFLAAIATGLLELGGARSTHSYVLAAARTLDQLESVEAVADATLALAASLTKDIFPHGSPSEELVHQALQHIDRHFAEELTDEMVADKVGLSTSHFRHLFRQVTRQPFQRYLLALRLEKAREMLLRSELSVSEVSQRSGFASAAHFSRVFAQRFGAAPTELRKGRRP